MCADKKISFEPAYINKMRVTQGVELPDDSGIEDAIAMAQKFTRHIAAVKEWKDRIESIEFLATNAEKLAGNPIYKTVDPDVKLAIAAFDGGEDEVDFQMFKEAVEVVINGYKQQALVGLAGESD